MSWFIVSHVQCVTIHTSALPEEPHPDCQDQSSLQLGGGVL